MNKANFYSSEIGQNQTLYFDPTTYVPADVNHGGRVLFELDGTKRAYLPNMRLLNVGVDSASGSAMLYNDLVGAAVVIDSIHLYDGKTELSGINRHQLYKGFLNQRNTNAYNTTVDSKLGKNSLGWAVEGVSRQVGRVEVSEGSTSYGHLDLAKVLPLLLEIQILPTALFPNLNIRINLNGKLGSQILNDVSVVPVSVRPILAADVIDDVKVIAGMVKSLGPGLTWSEVEHDRFYIDGKPTASPTTTADQLKKQTVNVTLNGFNNKHLERILIVKELTEPDLEVNTNIVKGFGRYGSPSCFRQQLQINVNGSSVLPNQGIIGNNERLAYLIDSFGDCSNYPGSNQYALDIDDVVKNGSDYLGQLDYQGLYIGKYIKTLQINYSRVGLHETGKRATTRPMYAHVFGAVNKLLSISGNSYAISYSQV